MGKGALLLSIKVHTLIISFKVIPKIIYIINTNS